MLYSRLFWKIFAAYAALTLVSAGAFVFILAGRQQRLITEQVQQRLRDSAVLLSSQTVHVFEDGPDADLQGTLRRLSKGTGTRMTLVAEDGTVLGDSAEDPSTMDDHRNRDELLQARRNGYGVSTRVSPTLEIPMMYYALRLGDRQRPVGFVRVSVPLASIHERIAAVERLILGTATAIALLALILTYIIVGRIIRPLATLTQAATAMAEGDLDQRVLVQSRDEFGTLAGAFNSMSRQLATRIQQLQQGRQQLAENSQRLETVLGGMVEGIIAVDAGERILFANRAAYSLLDFAMPDIVGRPIWEAVRNPKIHELLRNTLHGDQQQQAELELPQRKPQSGTKPGWGSKSVVALTAARLPGAPCPGVVLVLQDVTELRRLEKVRRDFVSNVSHELKTPLATLGAYTETLLEGAIDDPTRNREFLQRIAEQAERLHSLLLDLLQLARAESGQDVFEITAVPVVDAVHACLDRYADIAESKGICLTAESPAADTAGRPASHVLVDAEGLRTILDNLVDNAIHYTPAGGRVVVRVRREASASPETAMVGIEVEDTGIGIARDHQARVFERFYRVDRARSREHGGTGLGLSIVKHLVQEFSGSVEVSSELGKGSTFRVRLPAADGDP